MAHARKILFEVEDATKEVKDSAAFERAITVGAIPTLAPYILPGMIDRCRIRHPNLQINIREDFKQSLVRGVLDGELDLALVALPVREPMIQSEVLWQEKLVLAVSHGHPLASKRQVTPADLANETFILLGTSSSLAAQVRQFCGDHHFEPKIGARCAQVATVKALVSIEAGISILPEGAKSPSDRHSIAYVVLSDAEPVREIAVLRHMQRYQSRGSEQFLALLKEGPARAAPDARQPPKQGSQ
ncbi:MAG TPA: LysR family transcriptional regulator substrate-binding protein [Opitutaceae bacterium]